MNPAPTNLLVKKIELQARQFVKENFENPTESDYYLVRLAMIEGALVALTENLKDKGFLTPVLVNLGNFVKKSENK